MFLSWPVHFYKAGRDKSQVKYGCYSRPGRASDTPSGPDASDKVKHWRNSRRLPLQPPTLVLF